MTAFYHFNFNVLDLDKSLAFYNEAPGFFRMFTVLCAIMLLLAQEGLGLAEPGSGTWHVLSVYEGLTSWTVPALFMLWGMFALEEGKPQVSASLPEGDTWPLTTSAKARPPSLPSWQR